MFANSPVLISGLADSWKAREWVRSRLNEVGGEMGDRWVDTEIDLERMEALYGEGMMDLHTNSASSGTAAAADKKATRAKPHPFSL